MHIAYFLTGHLIKLPFLSSFLIWLRQTKHNWHLLWIEHNFLFAKRSLNKSHYKLLFCLIVEINVYF